MARQIQLKDTMVVIYGRTFLDEKLHITTDWVMASSLPIAQRWVDNTVLVRGSKEEPGALDIIEFHEGEIALVVIEVYMDGTRVNSETRSIDEVLGWD